MKFHILTPEVNEHDTDCGGCGNVVQDIDVGGTMVQAVQESVGRWVDVPQV